jgi:HlyD family secretion protein
VRRGRGTLLVAAVAAIVGLGAWQWLARPPAAMQWQGYAEADYVRVGPTQPGLLVSLAVARGDDVAAGAPLFAQDDAGDRAARDQARAALAEAAARLANLKSPAKPTEIAQAQADVRDLSAARDRIAGDLARAEALLPSGAATRQQVDQWRADARSAAAKVQAAEAKLAQMISPTGRHDEIVAQQAAVEAARAALAEAEWRLAQRQVSAPVGGRVAETYALPGEMLTAGTPVVELLPPQNILVRFFVPEPELPRIHLGTAVAVGCDHCPPDLRATVSFIAPQPEFTPPVIYSESARGKLVILVEARPPPARAVLLKPGQPLDVRPLPEPLR